MVWALCSWWKNAPILLFSLVLTCVTSNTTTIKTTITIMTGKMLSTSLASSRNCKPERAGEGTFRSGSITSPLKRSPGITPLISNQQTGQSDGGSIFKSTLPSQTDSNFHFQWAESCSQGFFPHLQITWTTNIKRRHMWNTQMDLSLRGKMLNSHCWVHFSKGKSMIKSTWVDQLKTGSHKNMRQPFVLNQIWAGCGLMMAF